MSENSNSNNKYLPESVIIFLKEAEEVERIRSATEKELHNERYKGFFDRFHPNSVETFIREYSCKKALYLAKGESYTKIVENKELKYKTEAEKALNEIQQKKLFNLQCQWRAEEINLPRVTICHDFFYWEAKIYNCPFLHPVTRSEMELYKKFLENEDISERYWLDSWQDYGKFKNEITEAAEEDEEETAGSMPGWYSYYDLHNGTGSLLLLPDIRGEKEDFYRSLERKQFFDKVKEDNGGKPFTGDPRPMASAYNLKIMEDFISEFDDRQLMEYFHAVEKINDRFSDKAELDNAYQLMRDAEHLISIKENEDWRVALKKAAKMYGQQMVAAMLPAVYDEYIFRIENKIPFEQNERTLKQAEHALKMCELAKAQIIGGRLLNGEDGNLLF